MNEFFNMGGYAVYVWTAYGITAFLLMGLVFGTVLVLKNSEKKLKALEVLSPRRRQRQKSSGGEDEKP
jgi:heme exporter protein D